MKLIHKHEWMSVHSAAFIETTNTWKVQRLGRTVSMLTKFSFLVRRRGKAHGIRVVSVTDYRQSRSNGLEVRIRPRWFNRVQRLARFNMVQGCLEMGENL